MHQDIVGLKSKLKELLQNKPQVLAAWEGGSAATGFLDDYSDLDLGIVTDKDMADELFGLIEEFFCADYGIIAKFRMPEPAWHGMSQCFYLLDKLPPLFYSTLRLCPRTIHISSQSQTGMETPLSGSTRRLFTNLIPPPEKSLTQ